jgi:hypothetical protein
MEKAIQVSKPANKKLEVIASEIDSFLKKGLDGYIGQRIHPEVLEKIKDDMKSFYEKIGATNIKFEDESDGSLTMTMTFIPATLHAIRVLEEIKDA